MDTTEHLDYMTSRLAAWRKWTDLPLLILAIGSLPLLLLELIRDDLILLDREFLDIANLVVLVAFAIDYFVELWLCSDRRAFVRSEWTSALIVVTQALAVIPALSAFGVLRVLRAGRVLRFLIVVLRIVAIGGVSAREGRSVLRRHAAAFGLGLAGFTWIMSAVLFTMVEDVGRGERVHSFFDALWWSLTTITTVGYGDVFPVTAAGRIVGGFTMVVGISTFALVTAKFAEFLVRSDLEDERADDARNASEPATQRPRDDQLDGVVELLSAVQREFADRDETIEALRGEVENLRERSA